MRQTHRQNPESKAPGRPWDPPMSGLKMPTYNLETQPLFANMDLENGPLFANVQTYAPLGPQATSYSTGYAGDGSMYVPQAMPPLTQSYAVQATPQYTTHYDPAMQMQMGGYNPAMQLQMAGA